MRRTSTWSLCCAWLLLSPSLAAQSEPTAEATTESADSGAGAAEAPPVPALTTAVREVTLYSQQALVHRRGTTAVPAGKSRWQLPGLPAALVESSVRARVVAGNSVKLLNLEVLSVNETTYRKEAAERVDTEVKEIQSRLKALTDSLANLTAESSFLRSFEVGKRVEDTATATPIDVEAWKSTLGFVDVGLTQNQAEVRRLNEEADGVREELAVALSRLRKLSSAKVDASKTVFVELEAGRAVDAELEVTYIVSGPGWWPRYDVRADVDAGTIELTSYALVRQESGEDWENVELTFSAAEPDRSADLPQLLSWRIGEEAAPVVAKGSAVRRRFALDDQLVSGGTGFNLIPDGNGPGRSVSPGLEHNPAAGKNVASGKVREYAPNQGISNFERFQFQDAQGTTNSFIDLPRDGGGRAGETAQRLRRIEEQMLTNGSLRANEDWAGYVEGNFKLQTELMNLAPDQREVFADELLACTAAIEVGERLLKSARLAAGIVAPVESSRGYDYKYRAVRPETIPSDGAYNQVVIGAEVITARFIYEATPELQPVFFLTATAKNQQRQPYLDGPASVFLGPDYIGAARVPTTARGEEFTVALGADESISVRRNAEIKRDTRGLFTSYHHYDHNIVIEVKNAKARSVRVAVLDRVPFTFDKNVRIDRGKVTPAVTKEDRKGLLRWELPLGPGAEHTIRFDYSVRVAADSRVVRHQDTSVEW